MKDGRRRKKIDGVCLSSSSSLILLFRLTPGAPKGVSCGLSGLVKAPQGELEDQWPGRLAAQRIPQRLPERHALLPPADRVADLAHPRVFLPPDLVQDAQAPR